MRLIEPSVIRHVVAGCAVALTLLASPVHAAPSLTFQPGPSGSFSGGPPQSMIFTIATGRLTRPSADDIVLARGMFPPAPNVQVPLKLVAPQANGTLVDITAAALGPGAPALTHPRHIVFDDLNGDGRNDIFVAAHGYDQAPFPGETNALLLSNSPGLYQDQSALLPSASDFSHSAAIADINGDGHLDIFVGNLGNSAFVGPYFLLGNGGTAFTKTSALLPASVATGARQYTASKFVDVNGDGHPDLVLGGSGFGSEPSIVLINDGSGDFSVHPVQVLPPALFGDANTVTVDIAVIDANGDGWPDLLLSQTQRSYAGAGIQVLVNDRHGGYADKSSTFLAQPTRLAGPWIQRLVVLDLNGDGYPDFFAQGIFGPTVADEFAWINDHLGHFVPVPRTVLGPTANPWMSAMTDINGDSLPDLVTFRTDAAGNIYYQTFLNTTTVSGIACAGFSDVDGSSPFCPSVEWIRNRGVTLGCVSALYCPEGVVARIGMAAFMKRLGDSMTIQPLMTEVTTGALDVAGSPVICASDPVAPAEFSQHAVVDGVVAAQGTGSSQLAMRVMASNDGTAWYPISSWTSAGAHAVHWSNFRTLASYDIAVGENVRFGLQLAHDSGASQLNAAACKLRARVTSRTSAVAPFDLSR